MERISQIYHMIAGYLSQAIGAFCGTMMDMMIETAEDRRSIKSLLMNTFNYAVIYSLVIFLGFKYTEIFAFMVLIAYIVIVGMTTVSLLVLSFLKWTSLFGDD